MDHEIMVSRADSLEELGTRIARLRYDALVVLMQVIESDLREQAEKDLARDRPRLAQLGFESVKHTADLRAVLTSMFTLSQKHMEKELAKNPQLIP